MAPALIHQPPKAIGYLRVSTAEQADSGAGLAAQRASIQAEAARQGWELEFIEDAGYSAKDLNRPGLATALARLDAHEADVLVVAKLDRLSRSVHDFTGLLAHSAAHSWSVACLDLGVDTSTPTGELHAHMVASVAHYERRLIGQRTRDALAEKRAAGVRLGRPQVLSADVVARIVAAHRAGKSLRQIGAELEADGVATARGGAIWQASTIKSVLTSQAARAL